MGRALLLTAGRCLVFLDEVDSLATSREDMHEATRRLLGVLLKYLDGFNSRGIAILIAATNRREDLDPALQSRFSLTIPFGLPDRRTRALILAQYAKHLTDQDREKIATESDGMSGRDIKAFCADAERRWASLILNKKAKGLPDLAAYLDALKARKM